jgi:hypothetical protein
MISHMADDSSSQEESESRLIMGVHGMWDYLSIIPGTHDEQIRPVLTVLKHLPEPCYIPETYNVEVNHLYEPLHRVGVWSYQMEKIKSPDYDKVLFIFGDNVEQFKTAKKGEGEAALREFNRYGVHRNHPRSCGIPVGMRKGEVFSDLSYPALNFINEALDQIEQTIIMMKYKRVVYVSHEKYDDDEDDPTFLPYLNGGVPIQTAFYIHRRLMKLQEIDILVD